jgi:hypothetical protein
MNLTYIIGVIIGMLFYDFLKFIFRNRWYWFPQVIFTKSFKFRTYLDDKHENIDEYRRYRDTVKHNMISVFIRRRRLFALYTSKTKGQIHEVESIR